MSLLMHNNQSPTYTGTVIAALLLLTSSAAMASTVVPLSVIEMTGRSQQIFHGVCLDAEADIVDGDLVTRLRFRVSESLKGAPADTLSVVLPGGVVDGIRYRISGMPEFSIGEEVVLFLTEPDSRGRAWPVGLAQGDFKVRRSEDGPPQVQRSMKDLHFQGAARTTSATPVELPSSDVPLRDLLVQIRSATSASGGPR
jgi:hypothetical protein